MNRARKRRITCEMDLEQDEEKGSGGIFGTVKVEKCQFMEEVDYKMEVGEENAEGNYVMVEVVDR